VALLIAPYLRKFAQYTVPDFLASRYGGGPGNRGNVVRALAVAATIAVSFTYVVAQIYAVGLIASRFTGVDFSVGIFLGLASILVCSFLGGMRAITWTQVAQYIIILVAFLIPTVWLSVKFAGNPVPQVAYGSVLPKLAKREAQLAVDPREEEVRARFRAKADEYGARVAGLPQSWEAGRVEAQHRLDAARVRNASLGEVRNAERELIAYPRTADEAARAWLEQRAANLARAQPPEPHAEPFPGKTPEESDQRRNNFLALVFCLMFGTAALPHILMRAYTTPSVHETRVSVFWTLFFILLIYLTMPALAVLAKYDIYTSVVGTDYASLPTWVSYWANVDKANPLISITDINGDGIVQLAEIAIDGDVLTLATPEIGGLPYTISGLVAAGGLAAALSTADGLLLAISNALSHDIYFKMVDPGASTQKRVTISKLLLLAVAFIAAYVASQKPADILSLVGAAFSLAGSTMFPALVAGVFWKRANHQGAIAGMLTGFMVCVYYMVHTNPILGGDANAAWFHIAPISAGVFGVPAGLAMLAVVSLLTPPPPRESIGLVEHIRAPEEV
jgi:cation/acetate symporter